MNIFLKQRKTQKTLVKNNARKKDHCNVFTLLELLIVISIIIILMSLLLPALRAVKEEGKKTVCNSNMRQIGQAVIMYATDYNDFFPGAPNGNAYFYRNLQDYTGIIPLAGNTKQPISVAKIYWCPADSYRANLISSLSNAYLCMFSYGVNYYCTWDVIPTRISNLQKPSKLLYLADSHRPEGYAVLFDGTTYPFTSTADPSRGVDFRHKNIFHGLWCDMHISTITRQNIWNTGNTYIK